MKYILLYIIVFSSLIDIVNALNSPLSHSSLQNGLKFRKLPRTNIEISELCLGTMMFGEQIGEEESFSQLDVAVKEFGLNFIDTAESWPAPSSPSTSGSSEEIIGRYMKKNGINRSNLVISSKFCGFSDEITWIRKDGSGTRVDRKNIVEAVDAQLKRMNTDYIDILQIHWPDRYTPLWGAEKYDHDLDQSRKDTASFQEQLEIMDELKKLGKIREWGLSNESPYGVTSFTKIAEMMNLSPPCVVQNCYNLLVRNDFETGMLEACAPSNCNVGLLAYSPLAGGALTGKYLNPDKYCGNARLHKYVGFMHRYISPTATAAVERYARVADEFALPLSTIASAWVYTRPHVISTLIGASNCKQLRENILALNVPVGVELETMINQAWKKGMDPTKGKFDIRDPKLEYIDPSKLPWGVKDQDVDPELDVLINQRLSKL
jgi:aryl-alcohol dehydrogenase-like predicted oxidoreductase